MMNFDYYYNQIPLEMRCLAPWQDNKYCDEIWGLYFYLFKLNIHEYPLTCLELCDRFKIKKYKQFRKLIRPLIQSGMVSQKTTTQDICNKQLWKYEITGLGIEYMKMMTQLIVGRVS